MSQPDLETTLRAIRPVASPELRERVRAIAKRPAPARRLAGRRRSLAIAVPLAAALAAALVAVFTGQNGSRPESSPAAKSSLHKRAGAPPHRIYENAPSRLTTEQLVVGTARALGGTVISRRVLAHAVELRLSFPHAKAREAMTRLAALPGTVRVDLTPHDARDADIVVVRVSRP
jgi:hypothetical protein